MLCWAAGAWPDKERLNGSGQVVIDLSSNDAFRQPRQSSPLGAKIAKTAAEWVLSNSKDSQLKGVC